MEDTVFNLQAFKKADNIYFCNSVFYIYSINMESVTNQRIPPQADGTYFPEH